MLPLNKYVKSGKLFRKLLLVAQKNHFLCIKESVSFAAETGKGRSDCLYCIHGYIRRRFIFYFRSFCLRCQRANLRLGEFQCRRAKITLGENNSVYSSIIHNKYIQKLCIARKTVIIMICIFSLSINVLHINIQTL